MRIVTEATRSSSQLESVLKIKPPENVQDVIEYNQVFKLEPSQHFYKAYNYCYQTNQALNVPALLGRATYLRDRFTLIDLRPNRWYKKFESLMESLKETEEQLVMAKKDLDDIKEAQKAIPGAEKWGAKNDSYEQLKSAYTKMLANYTTLTSIKQKLLAARESLLREISSSGYSVELPSASNASLTISKSVNEKPVPPAFDNETLSKLDLSDDRQWHNTIEKLTKILKPLITDEGKNEEIKKSLLELSSINQNPVIQEKIASYERNIAQLESELKSHERRRDNDLPTIIAAATAACQERNNALSRAIEDHKKRFKDTLDQMGFNNNCCNNPRDKAAWDALNDHQKEEMLRHRVDKFDDRFKARSAEHFPGTGGYTIDQLRGLIARMEQDKAANQQMTDQLAKDAKQKFTDEIESQIAACKSKKAVVEAQLENYKKTALLEARILFITKWNDVKNYDITTITKKPINPGVDPLRDFYESNSAQSAQSSKPFKIVRFSFQDDGYYDEENQSLYEFMESPNLDSKIAIFPYIGADGKVSNELFMAVRGPRKPIAVSELKYPEIKLVETHHLEVTWEEYSTSALMESINLFPNETKELTIQRQTKLTQAINQSRKAQSESQQRVASSFEDNLRSELSTTLNLSQSDKRAASYKRDERSGEKSAYEDFDDRSTDDSASLSAGGSFFDMFTADAKASTSSKRENKKTQTLSKENALAISAENQGEALTNSARSTANRNIFGSVSKVASETSSNNKLEVTSCSSEQMEAQSSSKEVMKFYNPNSGRTVNYNLFQIQNIYNISSSLIDTKLVLNTGNEIVEGTGIYDIRVFDLEKFNKLYRPDDNSNFSIVMCAFIARRVLKHYTTLSDINSYNDGILKVKIGTSDNQALMISIIADIYKQLDLSALLLSKSGKESEVSVAASAASSAEAAAASVVDSEGRSMETSISALRNALMLLKKFTFTFNATPTVQMSKHLVNAPAYHVDTQLGLIPATEPYLEQRRSAEINNVSGRADLVNALARRLGPQLFRSVEDNAKSAGSESPGSAAAADSANHTSEDRSALRRANQDAAFINVDINLDLGSSASRVGKAASAN